MPRKKCPMIVQVTDDDGGWVDHPDGVEHVSTVKAQSWIRKNMTKGDFRIISVRATGSFRKKSVEKTSLVLD